MPLNIAVPESERRLVPTKAATAALWVVVCVGVAWIAIQAWLVPAHWINPDEGAHLMDSRLVLEGLVPGIDYGARQPLYVYAYTPFLHLFGSSYISGRLMSVLATLLTGGIIYLIGRRLWGHIAGLTAGLLYLLAPSIVVNASVVKTEPLAMLLVSLGIFGLIVHIQKGWWWPLWLAGVTLGAGYYVRESTMAGMLAAALVVVFLWPQGWRLLLGRLATLSAAYGLACAAAVTLYAVNHSLGEVLSDEGLVPFWMVANALGQIGQWFGGVEASARQSDQSISRTVLNARDALQLSLPLAVGAGIGGCMWLWMRRRRPGTGAVGKRSEMFGVALTIIWLGCFLLLYAYHSTHRGFFQFYFREFIPPMALLSAFVVTTVFHRLNWQQWQIPILVGAYLLLALIFVAQYMGIGSGPVLALVAVAVVWWLVFRRGDATVPRWGGALCVFGLLIVWVVLGGFFGFLEPPRALLSLWLLPLLGVLGLGELVVRRVEWGRFFAFVALGLLAWSSVVTVVYAAQRIGPAYDSVWSPQTASQVVETIKSRSVPDDEVLSGAVIWEFEAGRQPFMRITHPLIFVNGISEQQATAITQRLREQPPQIVIFDGYTERTYLRRIVYLEELLETSYVLVDEVGGSRYPVKIYVLDTERAQQPGNGDYIEGNYSLFFQDELLSTYVNCLKPPCGSVGGLFDENAPLP